MKITKDLIKRLNPCQDRYDNYLNYYGDKALTIRQFMGRKNLTQADKLWVAFRLMPRANVRLAAADIAESVLHIFEDAYPNDDRPRKAIAIARAGDKDAAYSAAATRVAYSAYAASAAASAAYAAAAASSSSADAYASASADAYSSAFAAKDRSKQEKLIRKIVLKYWKN